MSSKIIQDIKEPRICDYYNNDLSCFKVMEKLDTEYQVALERIKILETENKKLKEENRLFNCFKKPQFEEDNITIFKEAIEQSFLTICDGDEDDLEPLSYKLMEDYLNHRNPEYKKYSVIKYVIQELDKLTEHQNLEWCELKVLTTIEAFGFSSEYAYWEPPLMNTIESAVESLCDFKISLVSLNPFQTE